MKALGDENRVEDASSLKNVVMRLMAQPTGLILISFATEAFQRVLLAS